MAALFERLAGTAEQQAQRWAALMAAPLQVFAPTVRARVAAALLDQRLMAGLGNLWANELCFLRGHSPWTPMGEVDVPALVRLAGTYIALAVAVQLLNAGATYVGARVGWAATNRLRADLMEHLLSLDMREHKERTPGEMIERIDGCNDMM